MDPTTVIIILAIHLVCSGGLYHLIGRGMPPRSGLGQWSAGAALFGTAYLGRLATGMHSAPPWALALDATMILAALLFISGLRQFLGQPPLHRRQLGFLLVVYALAYAAAVAWWGAVGRYGLLNATLGLLYATLACEGLRARPREFAGLRSPLLVLGLLMGTLGALTVARGLHIARVGTEVMYQGTFAQVYYAFASLAAVVLGLNLLWMVFVRLHAQLAELATRDALTRVLNRNGLDEVLERHFAAREPLPLVLLQVDVDHFKRINDEHGHATGDLMLRAVARTLAARVRGSDFIARVGGEEFLVGCVGADEAVAVALAERLRHGVGETVLEAPDGRGHLHCTVSIGVSRRCTARAGWDVAWRQADRALYAAKAAGRDQVTLADG